MSQTSKRAFVPGYPELALNTVTASENPVFFYNTPTADAPAMVTTRIS